jgi:hypothetical protein
MSFQTYLNNIQELTGKTPEAIKQNAIKSKILITGLTATEWITWLAKTYHLGRGHSMALWKYFVEKEWIKPTKSLLKPMKKSSNK